MDPLTLVLISVGLAMDAFAVSVCKGLSVKESRTRAMLTAGIWFGVFQGVMPVIGYFLGESMYSYIADYDHWVAFLILLVIGINMIRESFSGEEEMDDDMGMKVMLLLAIATSIDAFAVGISLAMDEADIAVSALVIGVITMVLSMAGFRIGALFGHLFSRKAEAAGGIILILIGIKMVLEHSGFL